MCVTLYEKALKAPDTPGLDYDLAWKQLSERWQPAMLDYLVTQQTNDAKLPTAFTAQKKITYLHTYLSRVEETVEYSETLRKVATVLFAIAAKVVENSEGESYLTIYNRFIEFSSSKKEQEEYQQKNVSINIFEVTHPFSIPLPISPLFAHMTSVALCNCQLSHFPRALLSIKNLRHLFLAGNRLGHLPDEMAGYKHLLTLDCQQNNFHFFPRVLLQISSIVFVILERNPLKAGPPADCKFKYRGPEADGTTD